MSSFQDLQSAAVAEVANRTKLVAELTSPTFLLRDKLASQLSIQHKISTTALSLGNNDAIALLSLVSPSKMHVSSSANAVFVAIHTLLVGGSWNQGSTAYRVACTGVKPCTWVDALHWPQLVPNDPSYKSPMNDQFQLSYAVLETKADEHASLAEALVAAKGDLSGPSYKDWLASRGATEFSLVGKVSGTKLALQLNVEKVVKLSTSVDLSTVTTDEAKQHAIDFSALTSAFVEPRTAKRDQDWEAVGVVVSNTQTLFDLIQRSLVKPLLAAAFAKPSTKKLSTSQNRLERPMPPRPRYPDGGGAGMAPSFPGSPGGFVGPSAGLGGLSGPGGFGDDLLPGGGSGTGGMLFGPGNPYFDGQMRNPRGPGPRFGGPSPGPGVPPGARFDPYGPPMGGFSGSPDPDHLRPPRDDKSFY